MNDMQYALNSDNETDRLYAAHDIAETNAPEMAQVLVSRLKKENAQVVKDAIVFALKTIPCCLVYDQLFNLFSSPEAYLRNQAVAIFGSEGNDAVPFLSSRLDHTNREIRKLILDSLYEIGTKDAVLAIRAYVHDQAENVRIAAVEYLGRLNDKESVPELVELFKNDNEAMLRSSILDTLAIIGNEKSIKTVVSLIKPLQAITMVDPPLYLPQLINLVCKTGDREDIIAVFKTIGISFTLSDDIVAGVLVALRRFSNLLEEKSITDIMLSLLMNGDIREDIRLSVADILGNKSYENTLTKEDFLENGKKLVRNPSMVIGGLKLLKACANDESMKCIKEILDQTDGEDSKMIYEDLFNGSTQIIPDTLKQ